MSDKINLKNLNIEEIESFLEIIGEPKYRAKQIFQWIHRGVASFDDMTNLSKELRQKLSELSYISCMKIVNVIESVVDGTKKYLLETTDGNIIESVLMEYKHGYSICISSQVGCRMGCKFCASTLRGLTRNLEPGEILDQVMIVGSNIGQRISNIVIMGIGEPLDNFDNVIKFLSLVNSEEGLNVGYRHITLSTCGLVPKILDLAKIDIPITLAISLHAPNDQLRKEIMPIANKYTIDEILSACRDYIKKTNRRITFEYALISGVNDSVENATELAKRLKNMLCHVNLIPINTINESGFKRSNPKAIKEFQQILQTNKIEATIRRELGSDINASCGQLRDAYLNK